MDQSDERGKEMQLEEADSLTENSKIIAGSAILIYMENSVLQSRLSCI